MCAGHIACEGVCAFSLWVFFCCFFLLLNFFIFFFVTSSLRWVCAHKNTKRDQNKHKSNIKWMGIVHMSVSGCGPNQYVSSWSVCESVSMCAGHIACEGVCAFSLWFFYFLNFFGFFGVFFIFWEFFLLLLCYSGYVHTKNTKRDQKKHKSNIKWMEIVHVSVSGCGPNQYVSSWSVCESVSMCAGHIACEGVCAFSLWFFYFLNFFGFFGVFLFFGSFFCYFFVTVGMCTQKHKKGPKKNTKAT